MNAPVIQIDWAAARRQVDAKAARKRSYAEAQAFNAMVDGLEHRVAFWQYVSAALAITAILIWIFK